MVEHGGLKAASRRACALLAMVVVMVVAFAPAGGAGAGTRPRPTFWTRIEWPGWPVTSSRCATDSSYADASQSPVWGEPTYAYITIRHSATGEPGCRPVR